MNTYYDVLIERASGSTWYVHIDSITGGALLADVSVNNWSGPAGHLAAGIETTVDTSHEYGSTSHLKWVSTNGGVGSGWTSSGPSGNASLYAVAPAYVAWVTPYEHLRAGNGATC